MYSLRRPSQVLLWSSIKSAAVQVIVGGQSVLGPSFGQVMDCSYLECWIVSCVQCIAALGRDGPGDGRYYFRPLRQARAIDLAEQLTMAFKPTHLEAYFILKYQRNL